MKINGSFMYHGFVGKGMNMVPAICKEAYENLMVDMNYEFALAVNPMLADLNDEWHKLNPELNENEHMDDITAIRYNRFMAERMQPTIDIINDKVTNMLGIAGKIMRDAYPTMRIDAKDCSVYWEILRFGSKEEGSYIEMYYEETESSNPFIR